MLMGGQHVVRVFQISQVVVQWSKESESTVRAESIFLSTNFLTVSQWLSSSPIVLRTNELRESERVSAW